MRILIVEDEAISALALHLLVERLGHEVVGSVDTGEAAVESAGSAQPDLVLMDTRLRSAMNGVEAANLIWSEHRVRSVFVSAHGASDLAADYRGAEPFLSLVKPVMDDELAAVLERIETP
jgi:CheY-like chemotaxis protein